MEQETRATERYQNKRTFTGSFVFWAGLLLALTTLDQLLKAWAFSSLQRDAGLLPYLGLVRWSNSAFAFSLPLPAALMYLVYAVALLSVSWYAIRGLGAFSFAPRLGCALILSGGLSNLVERLATGSVRDYLYLFHGIFNLADFYIFLGLLLVLGVSYRQGKGQA